jgi:hypothetical protein
MTPHPILGYGPFHDLRVALRPWVVYRRSSAAQLPDSAFVVAASEMLFLEL